MAVAPAPTAPAAPAAAVPAELLAALTAIARPLRDISYSANGIMVTLMTIKKIMDDHLYEGEQDYTDDGPDSFSDLLSEDGEEALRREVGNLAEEGQEFREWARHRGVTNVAYSLPEVMTGGRAPNDEREVPKEVPEEVPDEDSGEDGDEEEE